MLVDELPLTRSSKLDERLLLSEAGLGEPPSHDSTTAGPSPGLTGTPVSRY